MSSSTTVICPAGVWTKLSESPTWGFIYIWSNIPVTIGWRRNSSGIPWYSDGSQSLISPNKNTVFHGGPSAYCQIQVRPARRAILTWG